METNGYVIRVCLGILFTTFTSGGERAYLISRGPAYDSPYSDLHIRVTEWANRLGDSLVNFSKSLTAYDEITKTYTQTTGDTKIDGKQLLHEITQKVEILLRSKLKAVNDLVYEAERIYENYTYDEDLDIEYLNSKTLLSTTDVVGISEHSEYVSEMAMDAPTLTLTPDPKFNNIPINLDNSTIQVPTNVYDRFPKILNGVHWTEQLDEKFMENMKRDKSLRWQYFCSSEGFFRVYPGMKWPRDNEETGIDMYDCRVRSWYLQAATCPKSVLILLDTSGSMKGSRLIIARSTVKQILGTLDDDDYFNIIRFSEKVEFVDSCFANTLMPATLMNKLRLEDLIDTNITARYGADFKEAFDKAFYLLHTRGPSACNKAILLITDGVPEHYDAIFKHWTRNFQNIETRVFTFLIGREVDDDREVRWMACANKGYYSHISTLADVEDNVQNYIKVLSRPMVINRHHDEVWTSIYLDHMSALDRNTGLQFMTSVAVPVFDMKNETFFEGNLLGVVGTDIPLEMLKEVIPEYKLGANGYFFMINHNGYVLMHPDFRPYKKKKTAKEYILHPYYKNIDLTDVALPVNKKNFQTILNGLLSRHVKVGSADVEMLSHYDNMRRIVKRTYQILHCKVADTDFSIGIALPATSLSTVRHASATASVLKDCLNESNIEIAPWYYCKDLEPKLTGRARIEKLVELNGISNSGCDEDLINYLIFDTISLKNIKLNQLWSRVNRDDIELLFIGTKGGLTKYMTHRNVSVPTFISNNTNTLEADYYRRAIEGVERLDNQPRYTFTFSIPLVTKGFNVTNGIVTASAPITRDPEKAVGVPDVFSVVGLQMKYLRFERIFNESTFSRNCQDQICSCKNESINCYLVDNHGYVMASKNPSEQVGKFFGEIENHVMAELVYRGVFIGYNLTDYQAMCEIKNADKRTSSASNLLNPIKAVFNGLFWTITELFLFMSEFSLRSLVQNFHSVVAADNRMSEQDCEQIGDYDYVDLTPSERMSYNDIKMLCAPITDSKKIIGYRPCHKSFKLYRADFNKAKPNIQGELRECQYDYSHDGDEFGLQIMYSIIDDVQFATRLSIKIQCLRPYSVSWVRDTNLLLIVTSNTCETCPDYQPADFGLVHKEINYTEAEQCLNGNRTKSDKVFKCFDRFENETQTCGADLAQLSFNLYVCLCFSVLKSFIINL